MKTGKMAEKEVGAKARKTPKQRKRQKDETGPEKPWARGMDEMQSERDERCG